MIIWLNSITERFQWHVSICTMAKWGIIPTQYLSTKISYNVDHKYTSEQNFTSHEMEPIYIIYILTCTSQKL